MLKDFVRSIFKASVLFIYLENSHDESINYICTYCSKDNSTVYEMQVLCFWQYIDKVETTALFQYFCGSASCQRFLECLKILMFRAQLIIIVFIGLFDDYCLDFRFVSEMSENSAHCSDVVTEHRWCVQIVCFIRPTVQNPKGINYSTIYNIQRLQILTFKKLDSVFALVFGRLLKIMNLLSK